MFERFTDRALKVMALANQEAQRLNHDYIGTEHILLGLIKEGSGVGANVLRNLDISLRELRHDIEKLLKPGREMVTMGKLPQTPRAKLVVQLAIEEAPTVHEASPPKEVGTGCLLIGLLAEGEGVAAQALKSKGLTLEGVRQETMLLLNA